MKMRTRSRRITVPGGTYRAWRAWNNRTWLITRRGAQTVHLEDMIDWTNKKKDLYGYLPVTPLDHRVTWAVGGGVKASGGPRGSNNAHWHSFVAHSASASTHLVPPLVHTSKDKGNEAYLATLLARTNPYRPEYSIFVAIREMVELLTLFQVKAATLIGLPGSLYLNYRFGMQALLNDLRVVAGITKSIESRLKELRSLQRHGGVRRSQVKLDQYITRQEYGRWVVESAPAPLWIESSTDSREYRTKVTGSLRWLPAPGAWHILENMSPLEEFNLALRLVFDLEEPGIASAWNLIPFSWLIDYFYEIGSFLEATRGLSVVEPYYTCIVRRTTATRRGVITKAEPSNFKFSGQPHVKTVITKREPVNAKNVSLPTGFSPITMSEAKVILALLSQMKR